MSKILRWARDYPQYSSISITSSIFLLQALKKSVFVKTQNLTPQVSELIVQEKLSHFVALLDHDFPNKRELNELTCLAKAVDALKESYPQVPVRAILTKTGLITISMVPCQLLIDNDLIVESPDLFGIENWDPAEKINYFISFKGYLVLDLLLKEIVNANSHPAQEIKTNSN